MIKVGDYYREHDFVTYITDANASSISYLYINLHSDSEWRIGNSLPPNRFLSWIGLSYVKRTYPTFVGFKK